MFKNKIIIRQRIQWKFIRLINTLFKSSKVLSNTILIIPCDFEYIGGSRGDEAMILATINYFQNLKPHSVIYVAVFNEIGGNYVKRLGIKGVNSLNLTGCAYDIFKTYKEVSKISPSDIAILGADCMDGYYSNYTSIYLLALHDIFSSFLSSKCSLLGFSFNDNADVNVIKAFKIIGKKTYISIRDNVSLLRFIEKTGIKAKLTADVAFLLRPSSEFEGFYKLRKWTSERRSFNSKFIGFNIHPMLKKYELEEDMEKDAILVGRNIINILKVNSRINFVLIPHDNRKRISDVLMLDYLYKYLQSEGFSNRIYYDTEVYHADQIKALVALLDGMVTSRMHLAIACFGMCVPVMAVSYQGKFEGLFAHFNIPQSLIMDTASFLSDEFQKKFNLFYRQLDEETSLIRKFLPKVLSMSRENFNN